MKKDKINKKSKTKNEKQKPYEISFPFKKYLKQHPTWNTRASSYPKILQAVVPLLSVLIILGIRLQLEPHLKKDSPFLFFFAAIMISAWFGGFRPAFLATILSATVINYFLLNSNSLGLTNITDTLLLTFFVLIGTLMSFLSQLMHNTLQGMEIKNMQLKKSEEVYRLIVDTVKDYAIYTLNADGYITSWNQGAERIKKYKSEQVLGKHLSIFYTEEDIKQSKPWNALKIAANKDRYEDEGWRVKQDSTKFWGNVTITPLKDDQGKLRGFSIITRDMTAHRELDKRKDEFISIASHELKTPITSIKVFNQLMQKLAIKNKNIEFSHYLSRMERQIDRLTELITDLLDVSKIQAGKLEFKKETFDLNYLIDEVVENLQATTNKHKITVSGKTDKAVKADKDRINQVLINFLTNAIKYSPEAEKIIVKIIPHGEHVTVGVQDFGIGIPKDQQNKVFDRFYRIDGADRKTFPGLGMGLFISSEIIKRHNGKIWVESAPGEGATFYFTLSYK